MQLARMVLLRIDDTEEEEVENPDDEEATLADDILDEVEGDATDIAHADDLEGFGLIDETAVVAEEEKEEAKEEETESLEEDAEDVDFDTFDDVDEL